MNPVRKALVGGALAATALAGGAGGAARSNGTAGAATNPSSTSSTQVAPPTSGYGTPQGQAPQGQGQGQQGQGQQGQGQAPQGQPPKGSFDPSKGGHQANGKTEELLTGTTKAKAEAAAKARVEGATVQRSETDAEGAAYEVHLQKSDGSLVTVKLDSSFNVTSVADGPA
ncbi:MAG: hypothetical protein U0P45_05555 [Acidimicrobiales bacterium]